MKLYSVSYGLKEPMDTEKWLRFLHKIKRNYDWNHWIETVWFVKSDKSSREIYEDLFELGTFNGFFVTEINPDTIEAWTPTAFRTWLEKNKTNGQERLNQD